LRSEAAVGRPTPITKLAAIAATSSAAFAPLVDALRHRDASAAARQS